MKHFFNINYLLMLLSIIMLLISLFFGDFKTVTDILEENTINVVIRIILNISFFIIWIKCIFIWSKYDKKSINLILLIFLSGFFVIYYYPKALKNKWI